MDASETDADKSPQINMWKSQLRVVLWKNLIIRKRHWFLSACEALIPAILFLLIAFGRSKITSLSKQNIVNVTYNERYEISYIDHGFSLADTQLLYAPSNEYFDDVIHRVQEKFQLVNNNKQGFISEQQLLDSYAKSSNGTVFAVIFNSQKGSPQFDYTIRHHTPWFSWRTAQLYKDEYIFQPNMGSDYSYPGFLALQKALDISFIEKEKEKQGGHVPPLDLFSLEFPYPPYKMDSGISSVFMHYFPLFTMFSFIFVCPAVLKRVVEEKYSGIKELMRMVGMQPWMLWLGWFVYSILPMIFSVVLLVLIMKVDIFQAGYPPIEYADGSVLFVFLLLYCAAATVKCFFLSTLFYKPTLATLVGLLVWILSYFVPKYLIDEYSGLSFSNNMLLMLLPNMALHFGYGAISRYEIREIGVRWTNWFIPGGNGPSEVSLFNVCTMLVVDVLIYMLLTFYVDAINPGKYGVPKSVFFPFKALISLVRNRNNVKVVDKSEEAHLELGESSKGINLIGLTKRFGKKTVVRELTMSIGENEITILLGHNGAGKSTTMGMITGMIKKSGGHILVNGKEVRSSCDITESIGLCTQHNLFFPDLTVLEHLLFFALLKGKNCKNATIEAKELLETLHLEEKTDQLAHTLSGGMKRKLCLGMAVIGDSKILILDEPSSGMDPQSRRDMWDLLLKWRRTRTVLITTHFMEEADALGDRIAIMNEGELLCFDTPMNLKKKYDTGYHLRVLVKQGIPIDNIVKNLAKEIGLFINNLKLKRIDGNEVEFLIPFGNEYVKMCQHLESNKDPLQIESISFTYTSLEDVFLNSKGVDNEENGDLDSLDSSAPGNWPLPYQALFYKRYRFISRKFLTYLNPSIIAVAFLFLSIWLCRESNYTNSGGPPLKLSLKSYGKTRVFLNITDDEPQLRRMETFYTSLVNQAGSELVPVSDVSGAIVEGGIQNLPYYRRHMVAAAELTVRNISRETRFEATAMYNNLAEHSAPISLNLITSSFAKLLLGADYSIAASNHPLHSINTISSEELSEIQIGLLWLMIMPLGFLFFLGSFIYFPYTELSTKFTQLQFMTGVHPIFYWLSTFLSDLVIYAIFTVSMSIISMAWTPFRGFFECGALCVILMLYGLSGIPFAYLFGRKKSFSGAYALFIILGIMLGILLTVIVMVLEESGLEEYISVGHKLKTIFMIFCPQFGLTYLGVEYSKKVIQNYNFVHMDRLKFLSECSREGASPCCSGPGPACDAYRSYLKPHICYMLLGCVFYLALNIMLDSYGFKKLINWLGNLLRRNDNKDTSSSGDQNDNDSKYDTLRVKKLKKSYSGRQVVNGFTLNLKKGECMGILGVNGAGKTTTFRMLTREEVQDNGTIKINNFDINETEYLSKLGYCPQNDALNLSLTGRDILSTMAMLRGIHVNRNEVVKQFLELFGLTELADIPCEEYSGGNKRKLSFAVAVIGFPEFILLDEPTNGVDPIFRRKFWTLIKQIREKKHKSFILTSHSMTECEAVCNDLIIMKQGTIRKKGTISELKNQISGYNIRLKLKQDSEAGASPDKVYVGDQGSSIGCDEVDGASRTESATGGLKVVPKPNSEKVIKRLKESLRNDYSQGEFRDEHSGLIHFYIKETGKKWSELFNYFETLKSQFPDLIEDYSISEASLEDVFLDVANNNDTDDKAKC